ncbi:hypothetical protein MUY27_14315, partial [Mucilaginibacter sp. RS28]
VIGTLTEYLGMRKVYTKGLKAANKCMLLAGIAYNLKKLIKHKHKHLSSLAIVVISRYRETICFITNTVVIWQSKSEKFYIPRVLT